MSHKVKKIGKIRLKKEEIQMFVSLEIFGYQLFRLEVVKSPQ